MKVKSIILFSFMINIIFLTSCGAKYPPKPIFSKDETDIEKEMSRRKTKENSLKQNQ